MPEDDDFLQSILSQNREEDFFDNFGSQILIHGGGGVIVGGDDLNKIHQNFAGDTFSQISSTYEQQQNQPQKSLQMVNNSNNNLQEQQSQNEVVRSNSVNNPKHSKLHSYQEKKIEKKDQQNNDELLDLAILNNLNEDLNSPKDNNQFINNKSNIHGNHVLDLKLLHNNAGAFPSPHSNLNNMIMNSENLQQSDIQSTLTIYNSGIFDDASIMRILDKSISDDSLFYFQVPEDSTNINNSSKQQQQSQMRSGLEMEQTLRFECEDVKQILCNVSSKLKEKLQKQRQNSSSSQLVAIQFEELKQYEILTSSAIDKTRQIQSIGKHILDSQKVRSLTLKNYKQNLKIQLHNQIQKFKELCKKQYQQAERQKFKYQINEFEFNEKIKLLEERLDQQAEEINKIANKNEQLKYEKRLAAQKNELKLNEMEKILKVVMKNLQQNDNLAQAKNNNSFCVGTNHSLLLKPKHRINAINLYHQQQQLDIQQSVDEKENESILSNKGVPMTNNKELKSYLNQMKRLLKENKKMNQQLRDENNHYDNQQQEGGSYYESSSILNLMGEFRDQKRDSLIQQSQFIPEESSQADINQAFIMSENSQFSSSQSSSNSSNFIKNERFVNIEEEKEENNQSLDYNFKEDQILVVMDGVNKRKNKRPKNFIESNEVNSSLQFLDDKISANDLAGQQQKEGISESQRIMQEQHREKIMINKNQNNFFNEKFINISNGNSIDDDIDILDSLKKQPDFFPQDLSGIEKDFALNSVQGGLNLPSGRNIFIADEFTNESIDFNSRNNNAKLYSGGSSQFSMIQAFQSLRGVKPFSNRNELIVIQVQDRQITMPKLNLKGICGRGEVYKFNIPQNPSANSTSSLESCESLHSKIQQQQTQQQQMTSQQNITSFQNESISKQYHDLIESSFPDDGLDKAICIDNNNNNMSNSKFNNSAESNLKEGAYGNLFDSFKKELGMIEKTNMTKSTEKKQSQQIIKPILDESLFDNQSNVQFNDEFQQDFIKLVQSKISSNKPLVDEVKQQQQEDKSLDLSVNVSRFKKSQSDPNLMFNDVDSDEEFQRNKDTQDSKNCHGNHEEVKGKYQQKGGLLHHQPLNHKYDFTKLKTPQAALNKANIKIPTQNEEQKEPQQQDSKILFKGNLNQFQNKFRASSQFTNNSKTSENNESQKTVIQNVKKIVPAQAVGNPKKKILKFNAICKKDISHIIQRDQDQSMLMQPQSNLKPNGSPQQQKIDDESLEINIFQKQIQPDIKKISKPLAISSQRREMNNQSDEQNKQINLSTIQSNNSQKPKQQLMQNYIVQASKMSGVQSQKPSSLKLSIYSKQNGQGTRNSSGINSNLSQPDIDQDHQFSEQLKNIGKQYAKPLKIDNDLMQQMKDFQESQDLNVCQGVLRQGKFQNKINNMINDQDNKSSSLNKLGVSPDRSLMRASQSHTPQKNIILPSSQQIPLKLNYISESSQSQQQNPSVTSNYEDNYASAKQQVITSQGTTTAAVAKGSIATNNIIQKIMIQRKKIKNVQNTTVYHQSIDQSQLHEGNNDGNVTGFYQPNIDNSMMFVNDISSIQNQQQQPSSFLKKPQISIKLTKPQTIIKNEQQLLQGEQTFAANPNSNNAAATTAQSQVTSVQTNLNQDIAKLQKLLQNNSIRINKNSIKKVPVKNNKLNEESNYSSNQSVQRSNNTDIKNQNNTKMIINNQIMSQDLDLDKNYHSQQPNSTNGTQLDLSRVKISSNIDNNNNNINKNSNATNTNNSRILKRRAQDQIPKVTKVSINNSNINNQSRFNE